MNAVLITGASTGIGAACALALDKRGYRVFAGVRRAADGEALRQHASPHSGPSCSTSRMPPRLRRRPGCCGVNRVTPLPA